MATTALVHGTLLERYELNGQPMGPLGHSLGPSGVAALEVSSMSGFISTVAYDSWSRVRVVDPTGAWLADWVIDGIPDRLLAGDLDDDGDLELATLTPLGDVALLDGG